MPDELPKGWVKTTLGEIAEPSRERASPVKFPAIRYVGLEHIEPQNESRRTPRPIRGSQREGRADDAGRAFSCVRSFSGVGGPVLRRTARVDINSDEDRGTTETRRTDTIESAAMRLDYLKIDHFKNLNGFTIDFDET